MYLFLRLMVVVLCLSSVRIAYADVSFVSNPVWLSDSHVTEGNAVTISTVVTKRDLDAVHGTVSFFANGESVGTADFSLPHTVGGAVVAVSFVPKNGEHVVSAKITRAMVGSEEIVVSEEVRAAETLQVDPDADRDGIPDSNEIVSVPDEVRAETASALPSIAGVSTTVAGLVSEATERAGPLGERAFATTESWREKGKEFFNEKAAETNIRGFTDTSSSSREGVMGIGEMVLAYMYQAGAFVFGNVYAFYIFFILLILWMLRKVWRRYSLD